MQPVATSRLTPASSKGASQCLWKVNGSICERPIRRHRASNSHEHSGSSQAILLRSSFRSSSTCSGLGQRAVFSLKFIFAALPILFLDLWEVQKPRWLSSDCHATVGSHIAYCSVVAQTQGSVWTGQGGLFKSTKEDAIEQLDKRWGLAWEGDSYQKARYSGRQTPCVVLLLDFVFLRFRKPLNARKFGVTLCKL